MGTTNPSTESKQSASSNPGCHYVEQHLEKMKRTYGRMVILHSTFVILIALCLVPLILTTVDALLKPISTSSRLLLLFGGVAFFAVILKRFVIDPLRKSVSLLGLAWDLEESHPEFEERLTTTLQLNSDPDWKSRSTKILGMVALEAHHHLANSTKDQIRQHVLPPYAITLALSLIAIFVIFIGWNQYLLPSLKNVFNPLGSRELPRLNALVTPGNATVTEGESISVLVTGQKLQNAQLEILEKGEIVQSSPMIMNPERKQAEFSLEGIKKNLRYRVRVGDLYSPEFEIEVLTRPVIKKTAIRLEYPEYTGLKPLLIENPRSMIDLPSGTHLFLTAMSSEQPEKAFISMAGNRLEAGTIILNEFDGTWHSSWEVSPSEKDVGPWTINLISPRAVSGKPAQLEIRHVPDRLPKITIDMGKRNRIAVKPNERLMVPFDASDDYGITSLELMNEKVGEKPSSQPLVIPPSTTEHRSETLLDLSKWNLKPNDTVTIWIQVTDNRPDNLGGPQSSRSQRIEIRIDPEAIPAGEQAVQQQFRPLQQKLIESIEKLKTAESLSGDLAKLEPEQANPKMEKLSQLIDEARQTLENLSPWPESDPLFKGEIDASEKVAKNELKKARDLSGVLPNLVGKERQNQAEKAKDQLRDSIRKLEQVLDQVKKRNEDLKLAAKLDHLARQQDHLADQIRQPKTEEGNLRDPDSKKDHQTLQQKIAEDLREMVKKDLDAKSEQFQNRAKEADNLAKEAGEIQKQQEQLALITNEKSSVEEKKKKLNELLAREQQAIANQAKDFEGERDKQGNENRDKQSELGKARENMEEAARQIRQDRLDQAVQAAKEARDHLRKDLEPAAKKPGNENEEKGRPETVDDKKILLSQQERIMEAMAATRKNERDKAASKIQEQLADRTRQLQNKAQNLLKRHTDDKENQKANEEAVKQLQEAKEETRKADQLAKGKDSPPSPQEKKEQGDAKKNEDTANNPRKKEEVNKQQEKAAQSLENAVKSLNQVCESCKKCAKCNNPGGTGGSNPGNEASEKGSGDSNKENPQKATAQGKQKDLGKDGKPEQKPSSKDGQPQEDTGRDSQERKKGQHDSGQLAKAADAAEEAAQAPCPKATENAAREVNQLADQTAKNTKYPLRRLKEGSGQAKSKPGSDTSGRKSGSDPVNNSQKGPANEIINVQDNGLSGGPTSNWTRSVKKIEGNILDEKAAKVPERFKNLVQDYFEELSRIESQKKTDSKGVDR